MTTTIEHLLQAIPPDGFPFPTFVARANRLITWVRTRTVGAAAPDPIPERQLRTFLALGIIPPPTLRKGTARFGREHLVRAVIARWLEREGHGLGDIGTVLRRQSVAELERTLARLDPPTPASAARPFATFGLAPGVTVLIDPAVISDPHRLADALARVARLVPPPHTIGEL